MGECAENSPNKTREHLKKKLKSTSSSPFSHFLKNGSLGKLSMIFPKVMYQKLRSMVPISEQTKFSKCIGFFGSP